VSAVAKALQVARSNLHRRPSLRDWSPDSSADELLLARIRAVASERGSYGYRRVTALLKRELSAEGKPAANHKKVYRLMRAHQLLLQRHPRQCSSNDTVGHLAQRSPHPAGHGRCAHQPAMLSPCKKMERKLASVPLPETRRER